MSKKLEKLKEVNKSLTKKLSELETYMFIKNIANVTVLKINEDSPDVVVGIK